MKWTDWWLADSTPSNTLIVSDWPLWARRTFLLTLPVSLPLWVAAFLIFVAVTPAFVVCDLWCKQQTS